MQALREFKVDQVGLVPPQLLAMDEPCVLRGLVSHWPLVRACQQAGGEGAEAAAACLKSYWRDATVGVFRMAPSTQGHIAYNEDFSGFNFSREFLRFDQLLDQLLACREQDPSPYLYMGSTTVDTCLPGFRASHSLQLDSQEDALVSLWMGNQITVPAHQDWPSNIACCVAGRRRFTLFPPDAVADLYVGPLDLTPAGQPISLADASRPDVRRFPRFAQALDRALVAELAPGDAIYVPSLWWHQVEGLEGLNALVNYWWRRSPAWADSPNTALWLALATVRDLPPAERRAWRALFDHYVFEADANNTAAHLPAQARGLLAPFDETAMRRMRAWLMKKLNR